jgi:hypothetical protein
VTESGDVRKPSENGGKIEATAANLVPRALSHHRWYQANFPDYPHERRALLPGLL